MLRLVALARVGVIVGAAMLCLKGCGNPPLEPWLTEHLAEEFTTAKADEVRTFDDYLQLENRLFTELEEKVYSQVGSGPEYELVRYSAGSAADPQVRQPRC